MCSAGLVVNYSGQVVYLLRMPVHVAAVCFFSGGGDSFILRQTSWARRSSVALQLCVWVLVHVKVILDEASHREFVPNFEH